MPEVFTMSRHQNSNRRLTMFWIGLLLFITTHSTTNAFTTSFARPSAAHRTLSSSQRLDMSDENAGPDTDQAFDDDCGDECEIDWDAMPSWDEDDEDDDEVEAVFYNDDEQELASAGKPTVEQRRLHMEMQWQLSEAAEECVVEKPETCGSEKCPDCNGKGWSDCRFCHGTAVLRLDKTSFAVEEPTTMAAALSGTTTTTASKKFILPSSFSACKICQQGVEMCRTCKGSGWIAGWTQIPNQRKNKDNDPLLP